MDYKLEIVVIEVADADRSKVFDKAPGLPEVADLVKGDDFRVVQLTPPGSARRSPSVPGSRRPAPGSAEGLQLVVADVDAAREELAARACPGPAELRLVRVVQRPGREQLVRPGRHHAAAWPLTGADRGAEE